LRKRLSSRRALDWTYFFLTGAQTGFGSLVAFYLASLGWSRDRVGLALSASTLAALIAQAPGGAIIDAVRSRRSLAAIGFSMIALAAMILALKPTFAFTIFAQVLNGLTGGIIGPALSAISLGLVGQRALSARVGRNIRYGGAGTLLTATAIGVSGLWLSRSSIFFTVTALCVLGLISLSQIRSSEIDPAQARNAPKDEAGVLSIWNLGSNRNLVHFGVVIMLFQLSNTSALPILTERLGQAPEFPGVTVVSAFIVGPQIVVTLIAPWVGYWSELIGRKPLLLIGLGCQVLRAFLFGIVESPWTLIGVQLLDGVTGATITVLTTLIIADLTVGTGRFNLAQGFIGTLSGLAASVSTTAFGSMVHGFGDRAGFFVMSFLALLSTALAGFFVQETKKGDV
jgi:MFS family permease